MSRRNVRTESDTTWGRLVSMHVWRTIAYVAVAACAFAPASAAAQPSSTLTLRPLHVGDCQVIVQVATPRAGDQVGVVVELTESREQTLVAGRTELTFALSE